MSDLRPGDLVVLRLRGNKLLVVEEIDGDRVGVKWFDSSDRQFHSCRLNRADIRKVDE